MEEIGIDIKEETQVKVGRYDFYLFIFYFEMGNEMENVGFDLHYMNWEKYTCPMCPMLVFNLSNLLFFRFKYKNDYNTNVKKVFKEDDHSKFQIISFHLRRSGFIFNYCNIFTRTRHARLSRSPPTTD